MKHRIAGTALRIFGAALLTGLVIAVACSALFLTTLPAAVSLLLEPLSLLLIPGMLVAIVQVGSHDVSPDLILQTSAAFYFLLFCFLLLRRPRTHKQPL